MTWHKWWGASQWAAYLEHMDLPVKASSKQALADLEASRGDMLSARELADLLLDDPLFALRLLKEANKRLPRRMAKDITTPLGIILSLGTACFSEQLAQAPEVRDDNHGFIECEGRATLAARIALIYGSYHHDLDPGELALGAMLSDAGEIELWAFAPELPEAALNALGNGLAQRSEEAQRKVCGFAFKDLTLLMCEHWQLPPLILHLIRGDENMRSKLARLALNTARHLDRGPADSGLQRDLADAAKLTGASIQSLVGALPRLDVDEKAALIEAAEALRAGQVA
ncbi:MAG TPA: HDOD domain-containing protein [Parasulfuritortus sp.]